MIEGNERKTYEPKDPNLFYPLPLSAFEKAYIPEDHPKYEGDGASSYSSGKDGKYDRDKIEHIESFGIRLPDKWKEPEHREYLLNSFIVLAGLVAWKDGVRAGNDPEGYYEFVTKWWNENRIDRVGYRIKDEGPMFQDSFSKNGYAINSTRQLSEEEFREVCVYISGALSSEID
jgi:hypothetical protein